MRLFRPILLKAGIVALGTLAVAVFAADDPAEPPPAMITSSAAPTSPSSSLWNLPEFIERLPDFLSERLPDYESTGALRLYIRPHFGDFVHRDYVRVPVGVREKVSENIEVSTELESYFTSGLKEAAGYGFDRLQLGAKCEHILPNFDNDGLSVGINYQTPLSRPPMDLTDGHRHFRPYVAATNPLVPSWKILGYATITGDFLQRTALPENWGRNELHEDSLTFSAGVAKEWPRFHGSITASVTTSELVSNEHQQVYALRPEIVVPWKSRPSSKSQILFTLGARAIHGPDGNEFGASGSVRIEFNLKRGAPSTP